MKYLKMFENYFSEKLERLLSEMKTHKVGDEISYEKLYSYISALHDFDLDNEFVEDFITSKRTFQLKELPISEIGLDDVSQTLVDEYKEEYINTNWYPPILYNQEEGVIVDGYHRAKMLDDLKETHILVWC